MPISVVGTAQVKSITMRRMRIKVMMMKQVGQGQEDYADDADHNKGQGDGDAALGQDQRFERGDARFCC